MLHIQANTVVHAFKDLYSCFEQKRYYTVYTIGLFQLTKDQYCINWLQKWTASGSSTRRVLESPTMLTSQSKSLLTYFVAYFVCIVLLSCLSSFFNIVFLSEINKTLLNDSISVAASGPEGLGKSSVHRQVHHLPVKTHDEKENNLSFPGVDQYTQHIISRFGMKSLNNSAIKPIRPEFGQVINDINFQYLINPSDRCSEIHSVFIIVISAPSYWNKRQLIRQTWASTTFEKRRDLNWSANYAFLIGSTSRQEMQDHIDEESAEYQDIIQVDLVDSYKNLTLKSIALLHWANQHCLNNLRFVLKCDDDIFINTLYLESTLQRLPKNLPAIYGSANINIKPKRSPGIYRYIKFKSRELNVSSLET